MKTSLFHDLQWQLMISISLALPGFLNAQSGDPTGIDSTLVALLEENLYEINLAGSEFSGPGGDLLRREITGHPFILIGEQHGIKEVGMFTEAVFLEANRGQKTYLAIETDPFVAAKLEELVAKDIDGYQAFNRELTFTIPFYDNREDFAFLQTVFKNKQVDTPFFWGLDQVGGAADRLIFTRLIELAPNEKAREIAEEYLAKGKEGIQKLLSTGNPKEGLLMKMEAADYQRLYEAFGTEEKSEAYRMIAGMKLSQEIYTAWFEGRIYDNNFIRSQLMKRQFMEYYRQVKDEGDSLPKIVFKFGANHLFRGLNTTNVYDLGNLVSEMANMHGAQSLHIRFSGIKGTYDTAFSGSQVFDHTDEIDPNFLAAMGEKATGATWILIDMRPIRQLRLTNASEGLKRLIYAYDIMVLAPQAQAVTPLD